MTVTNMTPSHTFAIAYAMKKGVEMPNNVPWCIITSEKIYGPFSSCEKACEWLGRNENTFDENDTMVVPQCYLTLVENN